MIRLRFPRRAGIGAVVLVAGFTAASGAQSPALLQGIVDGEGWSTNASSNLLTRNAGRPSGLARVQLWGAFEPVRNWLPPKRDK